jgi:hypothetical protein
LARDSVSMPAWSAFDVAGFDVAGRAAPAFDVAGRAAPADCPVDFAMGTPSAIVGVRW